MEGIITGLGNSRAYNVFFDWLYPTYFPFIYKAHDLLSENVTPKLLSFMSELMTSRNGRIKFGDASANGIILFKECAKILNSYAKFVA